MSVILSVQDLHIDIPVSGGLLKAVRGISFDVNAGETLCVVGESGSGKSLTALALMNLLPRRARRSAGRLMLANEDLVACGERRMSDLRGNKIAMIFQEPMTSLNPSLTIGRQLGEVLVRHRGVSAGEARERAVYLLEKVGISSPATRLGQYPHQLSGGLRQRVMIAMALMCGPDVLIADEPTTALDVTIQAQILRVLIDLQKEFGLALVFITHDLGIVARIAHQVAVMYAGQFVEFASAEELFARPMHPYTQGLLRSLPKPGRRLAGTRLGSIPGIVPDLTEIKPGCAFANRCEHAKDECGAGDVAFLEPFADHHSRCLLPKAHALDNARRFALSSVSA